MDNRHLNVVRMKGVANALGALKRRVVFVGGATVALYIPPALSDDIRPTMDVDVVVEVANYNDFGLLEEKLRAQGFENDDTSPVICRYRYQGLIVDIAHTLPTALGFTNRWYAPGFASAVSCALDEQTSVLIFPAPLFIASKFEAFKDRGSGDGSTSQDFEDIVTVLDGRPEIWDELSQTDGELREYLRTELWQFLESAGYGEAVVAHLDPYTGSDRLAQMKERIAAFLR